MPFSGETFTHLFDWEKDPQRQEKIINARLEAEFDGIDTGLSSLSGRVTALESGGGARELLSAARTYYVRTDGSDSNNGLTNTSGGAFLTIQKAVNVIAETLDVGGQTVTVQVEDGTYTGAVSLKNVVGFAGAGTLIVQGNSATPANVIVSTTSANCFKADNIQTIWDIKDMKLQTTTGGSCIYLINSIARHGNINFGACATYHQRVETGSQLYVTSDYSITGSALRHHAANYQSYIECLFRTITITGTLSFTYFASCGMQSLLENSNNTYSGGTVTGTRYTVTTNGIAQTNGGGASFYPGNVAGSTATQGQYL